MNRIDRISAILVLLQSRPLVRAADMAARFGVSLRTVYRDIRSLDEAGVPVCGDSGVGYSLVDGYRLPPLMFSPAEALAFVTAEKFVERFTDQVNTYHYRAGMDKIRSVLKSVERNDLAEASDNIEICRSRRAPNPQLPNLLQTILVSISLRQALRMDYFTPSRNQHSERLVEAVGVNYLYPHWYLVAYCHWREEYRTFRLDRIQALDQTNIPFSLRHPSLSELQFDFDQSSCLIKVVLQTTPEGLLKMGDRKFYYGLVSEVEKEGIVEQTYLAYQVESIARFVLSNIDRVKVLEPIEVMERVEEILAQAKRSL